MIVLVNSMLLRKGLRTGISVISSDKINDKRGIDKFSNYILHTHRGNVKQLMVHKSTQKAHA